jgi:hypothetical protein
MRFAFSQQPARETAVECALAAMVGMITLHFMRTSLQPQHAMPSTGVVTTTERHCQNVWRTA